MIGWGVLFCVGPRTGVALRITPYPTGRIMSARFPAPKAFGAGYHHLVPPGQNPVGLASEARSTKQISDFRLIGLRCHAHDEWSFLIRKSDGSLCSAEEVSRIR